MSHIEHLATQTLLYLVTPLVQELSLSFQDLPWYIWILGFKLFSPTFLVANYFNCRPPSHKSILCMLHFLPFIKKYILLEIWLVCLVYLPFLYIQASDFLSIIIRGDVSGTISWSLFKNSRINTLKCAKDIHAVYAALWSYFALGWATGRRTCFPWSIGKPW